MANIKIRIEKLARPCDIDDCTRTAEVRLINEIDSIDPKLIGYYCWRCGNKLVNAAHLVKHEQP